MARWHQWVGSAGILSLELSLSLPPAVAASPEISYIVRDQALVAAVDGVERTLFDLTLSRPAHLFAPDSDATVFLIENGLTWVEEVADLDQDGLLDAVIGVSTGGNCCAPRYAIASLLPDGSFRFAPLVFWSWHAPQLIENEGEWILETRTDSQVYRHTYRQGQVVLLEARTIAPLVAIAELRAEAVIAGQQPATLSFDFNGDNQLDTMSCEVWERWQSLLCQFTLAEGTTIPLFQQVEAEELIRVDFVGCSRYGVLASTTNDLHDLVCDEDTVVTWNGEGYVWPEESDDLE